MFLRRRSLRFCAGVAREIVFLASFNQKAFVKFPTKRKVSDCTLGAFGRISLEINDQDSHTVTSAGCISKPASLHGTRNANLCEVAIATWRPPIPSYLCLQCQNQSERSLVTRPDNRIQFISPFLADSWGVQMLRELTIPSAFVFFVATELSKWKKREDKSSIFSFYDFKVKITNTGNIHYDEWMGRMTLG